MSNTLFLLEPEEVEKKPERLKVMAPGGGFIISPTHHVQLDTLSRISLLFRNGQKYGYYPLSF